MLSLHIIVFLNNSTSHQETFGRMTQRDGQLYSSQKSKLLLLEWNTFDKVDKSIESKSLPAHFFPPQTPPSPPTPSPPSPPSLQPSLAAIDLVITVISSGSDQFSEINLIYSSWLDSWLYFHINVHDIFWMFVYTALDMVYSTVQCYKYSQLTGLQDFCHKVVGVETAEYLTWRWSRCKPVSTRHSNRTGFGRFESLWSQDWV